jgi:hypothetical protein
VLINSVLSSLPMFMAYFLDYKRSVGFFLTIFGLDFFGKMIVRRSIG